MTLGGGMMTVAWLQYCLVQSLHDSTVTSSFAPKKTILDTKLKMCSLEYGVCALHYNPNPIFLGNVLPELLFN
jgi:hypothetical protein